MPHAAVLAQVGDADRVHERQQHSIIPALRPLRHHCHKKLNMKPCLGISTCLSRFVAVSKASAVRKHVLVSLDKSSEHCLGELDPAVGSQA